MKFRIVKQERLDGSFKYQPQRKSTGFWGWCYSWVNLDSQGYGDDHYDLTVDTLDEAVTIIHKAKTRFMHNTTKCFTIIPM